ncbi:MAG: hypothetical protein WC178_02560 [Candidatus Paceibacterota bacterium]
MPEDIQKFKTAKKDYVKFIQLIRKCRLGSIAKKGPTLIPKNEDTAKLLRKYLSQLYNDEVFTGFNERDKPFLEDSGINCEGDFLNSNYLATSCDEKEYFVISCNSVEFIDRYLRSLYIPDGFGFRIESDGLIGTRTIAGSENKSCKFTREEARLLSFLYSNANEGQKTENITRRCDLTKEQIRSACYNIRSKMQRNLGYSVGECKQILPSYSHGFYILNIFSE